MQIRGGVSEGRNRILPKARENNIVVQEMGDETLVYDLERNKGHHLNQVISFVWKNCDGKTSVEGMIKLLETNLNGKIEEDFVWLALSELEKAELLTRKLNKDEFAVAPHVSRRDILFRYAPLAVSLPVIMSLTAPLAAQSASCVQQGQSCTNDGQCCAGLACVFPIGAVITGTCLATA